MVARLLVMDRRLPRSAVKSHLFVTMPLSRIIVPLLSYLGLSNVVVVCLNLPL
jgi:hypothetical protein